MDRERTSRDSDLQLTGSHMQNEAKDSARFVPASSAPRLHHGGLRKKMGNNSREDKSLHQHWPERQDLASSAWQQPARLGVGQHRLYTSLSVAYQASFFTPLEMFPEQSYKCIPCLLHGLAGTEGSCFSVRFVIHRGVCTVGAHSIPQICCLHLPQLKKYSFFRNIVSLEKQN